MASVARGEQRSWRATGGGTGVLSLWTAYQGRVIRDERGVSVTEYALLAALMAIVALAAALVLGGALDTRFKEAGP